MISLPMLQETVKSCTNCELHKTRTNTVFSRGNPCAPICFVGEAPGEEEDLQGVPFVGKSGKLLDQTLTDLGLDVNYNDIYVCNIIKCRPPNNRRPNDDEVDQCMVWFDWQMSFVNPKVIVALGSTAMNNLINTTYGITKVHGQFFKRRDRLVMPIYHPSYVLRNGGSGPVFEEFKKDLQLAIQKSKE